MNSLNIMKFGFRFVAVVAALLLTAVPLFGQAPVGGLTGSVTDPNGAVVPGATVTLTRADTGFSRNVTTDAGGRYLLPSLPPGEYEVKVNAQGFSAQAKKVIVNVGLTGSLDFPLTIGASAEAVEVTAEAPIIDTVDNAVKAQITSSDIKRLPLNGRNFLDLAIIAPGATPVNGDSFDPTKAGYTGVSIGGQAGRSTRISLDGGDINDEVVGTTTQNFSPEIIQEFQVSTSSYDVSTGATSSGSVNIITRSGQNEFHGAGYLYFRNSDLSAFPGLTKVPDPDGKVRKPPFDREQFGGWASGRLIKDRAFWFASFEKNNQDQQAFITTGLAPGNPFDGATPQPFDERLSTVKLDFRVTDRHSAFARWSRNDNAQIAFFPVGAGAAGVPSGCSLCTTNSGAQTNLANQIVTGLTSSFGSRIVNDARFNFSTLGNRISPLGSGPEIRISATNFKVGTNRIFPQSTFQNRWQLRDDFSRQGDKHTIKSGVSWNHTQIFGSFQFWWPADILLHSPASAGKPFPVSDADLLAWPVRWIRIGVGDPNLPVNTPGGRTINDRLSFYAEDSWKAHPRLTFNLGVNYRFDTNLVNHDLPKPRILSTVLRGELGPTKRDKNNWGGRVGLAWDVKGDGGTVIRAGYGLYYDTVIDNLRLFERSDLGPAGGGYVSFDRFSFTFPTFPGNKDNVFSSPTTERYTLAEALRDLAAIRQSLTAPPDASKTNIDAHLATGSILDRNLATPYSNQVNAGLQQKLPWGLVFTGDFLYRLTVREYLNVDVNFAGAATGPIDQGLGPIGVFKSIGNSKYIAGNFRVERRFTKGFGLTGAYVLSRFKAVNGDGLGLGALVYNNFNPHESYGPAGQDRTHRVTITANWDVPGYKGDNWLGKVWLRDWSLGGISTIVSGQPLSVFVQDISLTGSSSAQSDLLEGAGFGEIGRGVKTVEELNSLISRWNSARAGQKDAFGRTIPALGSLPVDGTIRFGDSRISHDLRVTKSFRLGERARMDWITEIFNLFNVSNLINHDVNPLLPKVGQGCAGTTCTAAEIRDAGFLQPTDRATSIFGFGGPRAFQFAVRFEF